MLDYHIKYIIIVSTYIHTNYAGRAVRVYLKYLTNLDWERFVLHLDINKIIVAVVVRVLFQFFHKAKKKTLFFCYTVYPLVCPY